MRLIEAISKLADKALIERRSRPTISMEPWALLELSLLIEKDIGGRVYESNPMGGIEFNGVRFRPASAKPRMRVKAGRRPISMEEYFLLGIQWSVDELRALADAVARDKESRDYIGIYFD